MGFIIFTVAITVILFIADRKKTVAGLKKGGKKFLKILPAFLLMLVLLSAVLVLVPEEMMTKYLSGGNTFYSAVAGLLIGSVAILPGFVAFPLGSVLREQGVSMLVIAAFTSSLMMVGIITFPVEKQFFGIRFALWRNIFSFITAILIALAIGLVFGEVLP